MIRDEITYQIQTEFGFTPTPDQHRALLTFTDFLLSRDPHAVMILRGSAGTGKTSLASAIVRALVRGHQKVMLLAPTGRAAKVFSLNSGHPAFTIHRRIYREKAYAGIGGQFNLGDNLYADTLFMVDESSMISQGRDAAGAGAEAHSSFGSGSLLDDLIHYVYAGHNDRLLLIGDKAQLPPVGEQSSPALSSQVLQGYGLTVFECDLNEVLRQSQQSGILMNATRIRNLIPQLESSSSAVQEVPLPKVKFDGFADIRCVPGDELIESLASSYCQVGIDETMVITRSNKRANVYNQGIRAQVLGKEAELSSGDIIMIVRNNYYWLEKEDRKQRPMSFLANGDRAIVERVRHQRELYGFHFADVWLRFPDYDDYEMQLTVILEALMSESPALTRDQNEQLYSRVMDDYADLTVKAQRLKRLREDDYFNALQIKYAYAVTCHKAQGGQWSHVYVDQGYMTDDMLTPDYIHWLYTAFTRATDKLYLVNWPSKQTE